jgi:hypothetical protein
VRLLIAAGLLVARAAAVQSPADEALIRQSLPAWGRKTLDAPAFAAKYSLESRLNPFFQQGDFDSDGRLDLAVLIVEKTSGKHGVALLRRAAAAPVVVGAGRDFGNGGDDWGWMDVWRIEEAAATRPGVVRHDRRVEKSESGGGVVRWDGHAFRWRQAGD